MFPRPVLIYRAAPKLSLFAGADIKFAVFRAAEDQGNEIGKPATTTPWELIGISIWEPGSNTKWCTDSH